MSRRYIGILLFLLLSFSACKAAETPLPESPRSKTEAQSIPVPSKKEPKKRQDPAIQIKLEEISSKDEPDPSASDIAVTSSTSIEAPTTTPVNSEKTVTSSTVSDIPEPGPTASSPGSSVSVPAVQKPVVTAGSGSGFEDVELEVIAMINDERKALGLDLLLYDASLSKASYIRSTELYDNGYFDHTRPNGDSWRTVIEADVPVPYRMAGENLARVEHNMPDYDASTDAGHWFNGWKNSPSHYENMIRSGYTHVGVAIYRQKDKTGMVYAYAASIFAAY